MLRFDIKKTGNKLYHGSTGFLYGMAEPNVPSIELLRALKPSFLVQKAKGGKQHPTGDAVRVSSGLVEAGVKNIQVYLQDIYMEWPYECPYDDNKNADISDFEKKVTDIITDMVVLKDEKGCPIKRSDGSFELIENYNKYSYVPFNEPDAIWFSNTQKGKAEFFKAWERIYKVIHSIVPDALCAGPNNTSYIKSFYEEFFEFCYLHNCLPEIITWHELFDTSSPEELGQKDSTLSYNSHYEHITSLKEKYYTAEYFKKSGKTAFSPKIAVNEYALFDDIGAAGVLVRWIAMFEYTDISACMAYWGLANSLNEMAVEHNKPNSVWWVYRWYAQMTGEKIFPEDYDYNPEDPFYALTSFDSENEILYSLLGGSKTERSVLYENINADSVHLKLYKVGFSGQHGFLSHPEVVEDSNVKLQNDSFKLNISDCDEMDAYFAIISLKSDNAEVRCNNTHPTQKYEAEDAVLLKNAKVITRYTEKDLAVSGRALVGNILNKGDGVEFNVKTDCDGKYELKIYYSLKAPDVDPITLEQSENGQNRAVGKALSYILEIDNVKEQIIFNSTATHGYIGCKSVYVNLKKGEHILKLMHNGENQSRLNEKVRLNAMLDKIDLCYNDVLDNSESIFSNYHKVPDIYVSFNECLSFAKGFNSCEGGICGDTEAEFCAVAEKSGLYKININGENLADLSLKKLALVYAKTAKSDENIKTKLIPVYDYVYLTAGINTFSVSTKANSILKDIIFKFDAQMTKDNLKKITAKDITKISGNAKLQKHNFAECGFVIKDIGALKDDKPCDSFISFKVNAEHEGDYKLIVTYSNNEPAPVMLKPNGEYYVHPYNTDLVERYAQICVNDKDIQTVYFKNTLSWDTFFDMVIDLKLKKGENIIKVFNDNSYKISELFNSSAPHFESFSIIASTLKDKMYSQK